MSSFERSVFKNGSTTYYWSSKFFPKSVRSDIFKLYSFVRIVDDLVDQVPSDVRGFNEVKRRWETAKKLQNDQASGSAADDSRIVRAVKNITQLTHYYDLAPEWTDAFLRSMQMDIDEQQYETLEDSLRYVYGSAEVIGLYMARLLRLPPEATVAAQMQGRAMQWINFIRDINEDNTLGRCYFPADERMRYGLADLKEATARVNPDGYEKFIRWQIKRYRAWQQEADDGFRHIPRRLRIPVRTAADMYAWTARQIEHDPFIVYEHKVKPSKKRVIQTASKRVLNA